MSAAIVLVGGHTELERALTDAGARVRRLDDARELDGTIDGAAAVVVVGIDPGVRVAQAAGQRDRSLPVLVLEAADRLDDARDRIHTAPFVGRNARCVDASRPVPELAAEVLGEAAAEQRRDVHASRLEAIARMPLPGAFADQRTASQYLGQIVEHAPIGVATVDPEGNVRGWNPCAGQITGRDGRDAIGSRFETLFHEADRTRLRDLLAQAAGTLGSLDGVFSRRGPHGDDQQLELVAASLDEGVGGMGTLILFQDVTDRVRSEAELAARAREAMLTADVGTAVTTPGPLRRKLQRCAEAVVEHLDAAFARIWSLDDARQELCLEASAGMYTHLDGEHSRVPVGSYKIGRIASNRRAHLTNDVRGDAEVSDPEWAEREAMVSFAGYPLVAGDRLWGVLAMFARHPLPAETLGALAAVADTVAVGIQQADSEERIRSLLEAEQDARRAAEDLTERYAALARTLQQSLLPPVLPDVAGLEVAARYHWAGSGSEIGGDFYDLLDLPDGRWCAVLGDISGKGVGAARTTALIRYTLRAVARTESDLATLAEVLNASVRDDPASDRYCTLVLAAGCPEDPSRLSLLLAGHPFPFVVLPDGSLREIGVPNVPIGLFEDAEFRVSEEEVPSGACVVLFTDGVTDARAPDGAFHAGLPEEVLPRMAGRGPAEVAAALEAATVAYQEGRPADDVAIMVLGRPAGAAQER